MATPLADSPLHERHRPEQSLLCQLVEQHYPAFVAALAEAGRSLPRYVEREFEQREQECAHQNSAGQGGGGSAAPRMGWAQRRKRGVWDRICALRAVPAGR
jgi:hypothetical protein